MIPRTIDTFLIQTPQMRFNFDNKEFVGLEGVLNEIPKQFTKMENE